MGTGMVLFRAGEGERRSVTPVPEHVGSITATSPTASRAMGQPIYLTNNKTVLFYLPSIIPSRITSIG